MTDLHMDNMTLAQAAANPLGGRIERIAGSLLAPLADWRRRARGRAELARLSERELYDIGISAADRSVELAKPFWRV